MKALITGASGFVGYAVAKELLAAGFSVKAMVRSQPPTHLQKLPVKLCYGDLCDRNSLIKALEDCNYLFHVAAHYSLWERDPSILYRTNVEGTKNLLSLAVERCEKIVYTSSVATIKTSMDETPVNEERVTHLDDIVGHYKKSKYLAEQEAKKLAEQGGPITIVNPSAPVGSYDVKPTPTGKIIVDFLKKRMFGYLHTGLNLVAVEDVAHGHLLAAQKGKNGRRYILSNENLYLIDIFRKLEKLCDVEAPALQVPYWLAYGVGLCSNSWAKLTGKPPQVPLDGVRMARKCMFFDNTRAKEELGFAPTSVGAALQRAIAWFYDNNYA